MNVFMLFLGPLSIAGLLASMFFAYTGAGVDDLGRHVLTGLLSSLGAIFILVAIMFYFIATGSIIKGVVRDGLMDIEKYRFTRKFKGKLFPWTSASILTLMLSPIFGAAGDAGKLPVWTHSAMSWLALLLYVVVFYKSINLMLVNKPLLVEAILAMEANETKGDTDDSD